MPLAQADRIAFSSQIIGSAAQISGLQGAQAQLQTQIVKLQSLDTANKNLFTNPNALVNGYQQELSDLDGNGRTTIIEQDIVDAANKKLQNHFFPNDTSVTVPSLSSVNNVWAQTVPYALGFGIGKSYSETYTTVAKEPDLIAAVAALISNTSAYTNHDLTTGTSTAGSCSLPSYTDQATCTANGGTWTSDATLIATLLANMKTAVNALLAFVTTEASIIVTTDTSSPNQSQNAAAISNINTIFNPALNTWIALPDFEATGAGPSKLHSTQLTALSTALSNRSTFITTRIGQLNTTLGTVSQNITNGSVTGSGLYLSRYNYLSLRLNVLSGSLTQITNAQNAAGAQTSIISSISSTASTYSSFLPTSAFKSSGNGTSIVHLVSPTLFSPGDTVYITADNQTELQFAIKTIVNDTVTLSDIVPAKYTTSSNVRIYKDLT